MRTLDDLQGAFALLERDADEYAASHDEILVASADVITLSAAPSRRRRVRPALWLTAAAVAAAATAGSLVLINSGLSHGHAVAPEAKVEPPVTKDQLVLPFSIPDSLGYEIVDTQVNGDFRSAELVDASSRIDLTLFPLSDRSVDTKSGTPVDINGVRGLYIDDNLIPHPGQTPVATTSAGPDYGDQFGRSVRWRSPVSGEWIGLQTQGPPVTKGELLALARGLSLAPGGSTPVTSVFSISRAPAGMHLRGIDTSQHSVSDNPPFRLQTPAWQTGVDYHAAGEGDGIQIRMNTSKHDGYTDPRDPTGEWAGMHVGPWTTGATQVTISGRKGFWDPANHILSLKLDDDVFLTVQETWDQGQPDFWMPYEQLADVARLVTVVPHPEDRSSWLEASKALPIGG